MILLGAVPKGAKAGTVSLRQILTMTEAEKTKQGEEGCEEESPGDSKDSDLRREKAYAGRLKCQAK